MVSRLFIIFPICRITILKYTDKFNPNIQKFSELSNNLIQKHFPLFLKLKFIIKNFRMIKIFMMGDPEAGKTSIAKILFEKHVTKKTLSLSFSEVYDFRIHQINFKLYDMPSDCFQKGQLMSEMKQLKENYAFIYVINPKRDTNQSLQKFNAIYQYMKTLQKSALSYFVFINKYDIDLMNPQNQESMIINIKKTLLQKGVDPMKLHFQFTSIANHSIYLAFSKIIQKSLPCTPYLTSMLNKLAQCCRIQKVFIYDIVTKLIMAHNDKVRALDQPYLVCSQIVDLYVNMNLTFEQAGDQYEGPQRDKAEIKIHCGDQSQKKIYRFEQIEHSLTICFCVEENNYERQHLFDRNINVIAEGLIKLMNQMIKYI